MQPPFCKNTANVPGTALHRDQWHPHGRLRARPDDWERLDGVPQVVEVPTLFIGAVDDIVVSPEHIEGMKPYVTNLDSHVLENCGHWSQQEKPAEVNRILIDWLTR